MNYPSLMKTQKTVLFASFLFSVTILFSACFGGEEKVPEPTDPSLEISETDAPGVISQETKSPKERKEELVALIFESGFDSPEYYDQLEMLVRNTQTQLVTTQARNAKNSKECEKLSNEQARNECMNIFAYEKAMTDKDETACLNLTDKSQQEDCKNQVYVLLATEKQDVSFCKRLTQETFQKDCERNVTYAKAVSDRDPALCDELDQDSYQEICKQEIEMQNQIEERTR